MKPIGYYQAALFLSSDFFSKYWVHITGYNFDLKDTEIIKLEFREIVVKLMTGETVFWNISFSDKSIVDIETIINNVIDKKFSHIYSPLKLLMLAFDKKNSESEMLLSFLYRIATNIEFCIDEGISSKTHEYINLCIDGVQKEDIDLLSFYGLWEKSNCQWDVSLKSLTPDQPNYLADVFISIYQSDIILPSVFHLLGEISEISEKNICLSEVKNAMLNYYSDNTGVNEAVKLLPITT